MLYHGTRCVKYALIYRCFIYQDQNETLLQRLDHSESSLGQQLRQAREALAARSQELDGLKAEWTNRLSDISCRHAQEMNSDREKAIKVW